MKFEECGREIEIKVQKIKCGDMVSISMSQKHIILDKEEANELIKEIQSKFEA